MEDWARLKRLGRFFLGRPHSALLLPVAGGGMEVLHASSDSDWAQDPESRKSISCGALEIGGCSQGVFVRGQSTLASSSGEAEFLAAGSTANEAVGLAGVYEELGFPLQVVLQLDSTAAIGMIQRRGTGKIRHLDVRYLKLQEMLRNGQISSLAKIPTLDNCADIGTKPLSADRLRYLLNLIGYVDTEHENVIAGVVKEDGDNLVRVLRLLVAELGKSARRH